MHNSISVITICYNCKNSFTRTIDSVISQHYNNIQYVVIDGGSSDGTVDVIKENSHTIDYWISEKDKGIYDAMSKGLAQATGDWVIFMNAGDVFASDNVLHSVFDNKDYSGFSAIFGDMIEEINGQAVVIKANPFFKSNSYITSMGFSHQSVFLSTELAKKYGFDHDFKVAADYRMIHKIYEENPNFSYVPLAIGHIEPAGFSHQNKRLWLKETAVIVGCPDNFLTKVMIEYRMFRYWLRDLRRKFI